MVAQSNDLNALQTNEYKAEKEQNESLKELNERNVQKLEDESEALRQSESDKNEILKNENAAKQQTIESLENKLNLITVQYQKITLKLKEKTENNEKLTVKCNDIIEEQKRFKDKI